MRMQLRRVMRVAIAVTLTACGGPDDEQDTTSPTSTPTGTTPDTTTIGVYSETPPMLTPDVQTFFGTFFGLGATLTDFRRDTDTKVEGTESLRATVNASGDGFAGWFISWGDASRVANEQFTTNQTRFAGGSVRFAVRSPVDLEVGIRGANTPPGLETSKVLLSRLGFTPGANWARLCLPLAMVSGPSPLADLSRIKVLFVISTSHASRGTNGAVTFFVDDVRWDTRPC
jgi:hypothetical protein